MTSVQKASRSAGAIVGGTDPSDANVLLPPSNTDLEPEWWGAYLPTPPVALQQPGGTGASRL
jgi:hypothetical protein